MTVCILSRDLDICSGGTPYYFATVSAASGPNTALEA